MDAVGTFPFGQPVLPLTQKDQSPKPVFVLGVYASAVHARWLDADGRQRIAAVGVVSEPEIFWRGDADEAQSIIDGIELPPGAGTLIPAGERELKDSRAVSDKRATRSRHLFTRPPHDTWSTGRP